VPAQEAAGQRAEEPVHSRGVFEPPPDQDPKLARLLHIDYDLMLGEGQDSLERLADLYETAETIGPEALDKHFDELLERQRRLISVYFTEYQTDLTARSAG
jgi:nitrate reductase assembly molybdenum cofactor insertion protein NarJ